VGVTEHVSVSNDIAGWVTVGVTVSVGVAVGVAMRITRTRGGA